MAYKKAVLASARKILRDAVGIKNRGVQRDIALEASAIIAIMSGTKRKKRKTMKVVRAGGDLSGDVGERDYKPTGD